MREVTSVTSVTGAIVPPVVALHFGVFLLIATITGFFLRSTLIGLAGVFKLLLNFFQRKMCFSAAIFVEFSCTNEEVKTRIFPSLWCITFGAAAFTATPSITLVSLTTLTLTPITPTAFFVSTGIRGIQVSGFPCISLVDMQVAKSTALACSLLLAYS